MVRTHPTRRSSVLSPPLARADRHLLRILDQTASEARRLAERSDGTSWLACRPGCSVCCHGPFPINALDVLRLRQGLELMEASDPARAARLRARADAQVLSLRQELPGDPQTGTLAGPVEVEEGGEIRRVDDERVEAFLDHQGPTPCPVLDPASGTCELYSHRPVICRTYGPPERSGETKLSHCTLCFQGAAPEVVEACRVESDPTGVEDRILDRIEPEGEAETLVAFAVSTLG